MKFVSKSKLELSDTLLPDLFIVNHMNSLELVDLKVYIYILYLEKSGDEIDAVSMAKKLNISEQDISYSLDRLQSEELINKTANGFNIVNLKEVEINKLYVPKMEPKKTKVFVEQEQARTLAASAISESFFNGLMSFSWYTDIGILFDKYKFCEEVMIALFHYCDERKALNKKYVYAVAENWYKGGVKTFEQLEEYLDKITKFQIVIQKISKSLRLSRNLTKYEEAYVNKWIYEYKYDFDMIEEALKRTVSKSNPSINYVNGILSNWYKKGYVKVSDIQNETRVSTTIKNANVNNKVKYKDYGQREYDNLETYYDNM
ncbi:MAG: replication protein DnaD [Clostridia bacterium]|jgi:DnaD/phage-associated family protein|nr:replication protein DnaD [Clostridia bacterium]